MKSAVTINGLEVKRVVVHQEDRDLLGDAGAFDNAFAALKKALLSVSWKFQRGEVFRIVATVEKKGA